MTGFCKITNKQGIIRSVIIEVNRQHPVKDTKIQGLKGILN